MVLSSCVHTLTFYTAVHVDYFVLYTWKYTSISATDATNWLFTGSGSVPEPERFIESRELRALVLLIARTQNLYFEVLKTSLFCTAVGPPGGFAEKIMIRQVT